MASFSVGAEFGNTSAMGAYRSKMLRSMNTFHLRQIREPEFGEDLPALFPENYAFQLEWPAASLNAWNVATTSGDSLPLESTSATQF